jgi:16S rRNA processing protein RimM
MNPEVHVMNGAQQPPEYLVVGRIVRPHGVRGAMIIDPLSSLIRSITPFSQVWIGHPPVEHQVEDIRPHRDRYLLMLLEFTSREEAEGVRGLELQLRFDRVEPLPEGEYYHWQILGLQVKSVDETNLGEVVQILETGANDVYVVRRQDGKELLIPAIPQVIKRVNLDQGELEIEPLPGLLDP